MSSTAPHILPLHHSFIRVIECILQIYIYGRCHIVDLCQRQMWFICDGKGWTFFGRICLYLLVLPFLFANLSPVRPMRSDVASDTLVISITCLLVSLDTLLLYQTEKSTQALECQFVLSPQQFIPKGQEIFATAQPQSVHCRPRKLRPFSRLERGSFTSLPHRNSTFLTPKTTGPLTKSTQVVEGKRSTELRR